jgi:hypothetical protein
VRVDVQGVFKDLGGQPTAEPTPWTRLVLAPGATETVHFVAANPAAAGSAIRIRTAR